MELRAAPSPGSGGIAFVTVAEHEQRRQDVGHKLDDLRTAKLFAEEQCSAVSKEGGDSRGLRDLLTSLQLWIAAVSAVDRWGVYAMEWEEGYTAGSAGPACCCRSAMLRARLSLALPICDRALLGSTGSEQL